MFFKMKDIETVTFENCNFEGRILDAVFVRLDTINIEIDKDAAVRKFRKLSKRLEKEDRNKRSTRGYAKSVTS